MAYGSDTGSEVNVIWWTKVPVSMALVYYSLVDWTDEFTTSDSLACSHNKLAKGVLARTPVNGKYVQRVLISGLIPNRRYCYEITSGKASSNIYTFRTSSRSISMEIKNISNRSTISHESHANFIVYSSYLKTEYVMPNDVEENKEKVDWEIYDNRIQKVAKSGSNQTSNQDNSLGQQELANLFINSFKKELNYRKIYGLFNLISSDIDTLNSYSDALANIQLLPTLKGLGRRSHQGNHLIFRKSLINSSFFCR